MDFLNTVREEAEKLAAEKGLTLYDIEWVTENKTNVLRISLDIPDRPIDIDTCSEFSDAFSEILDQKDLISSMYYLDVCSPGAERELRNTEEIKGALGEYVYVKLKDPKQGIHEIEGDMTEITDDAITLQYREKTREKEFKISLDNISFIRLAIKF
mgnify:CR=1 FL=1